MVEIPCLLCGNIIDIRFSKRDKPYLVCDLCGSQLFCRASKSEKILKDKAKSYNKNKLGGKHG